MNKHTPGPWRVEQYTNAFIYSGKTEICELFDDNQEANAALIASAPDLLEACKRLLELAENGKEWKTRHGVEVITARRAIDKAEGR